MSNLRKILPSTRSLFVFEAAARCLNFKQAAAELNVTQPSVSHTMRELEQAIGVKLFSRSNRGVELTQQGRALYECVSAGFGQIERGLKRIQAASTHYITFAASASLTSHWLVPKLPLFQQLHPQIKIKLLASDHDVEATGEIDVTIRMHPRSFEHKSCWYLADEVIFPVCAPFYLENAPPLHSIEDLPNHRLIHAFDLYRQRCKWNDWFRLMGFPMITVNPEPDLVFNNHQMATQSALAGMGVALGWSFTEDLPLTNGRLVRPLGNPEVRTGNAFFLIANPQSRHFKAIKLLASWIISQVSAVKTAHMASSLHSQNLQDNV